MTEFCKKHAVIASFLAAEALGVVVSLIDLIRPGGRYAGNFVEELFLGGLLGGIILIYPLVLSALEIVYLFLGIKSERVIRQGKLFDGIGMVLGFFYTVFYGSIQEICFDRDWTETLYNSQVHSPIFTQAYPTVIVIGAVALAGYLVLTYVPIRKLPPLVIVCSIAAMYLGMAECIFWIVQFFGGGDYILMCLAPFDLIVIGIKTMRNKMLEWNPAMEEGRNYRRGWMKKFRHFYDTYGFPIAKAIHSPYIADAVYILMKPLEWFFLIVIYFCDAKPENRIAMQYTGRHCIA